MPACLNRSVGLPPIFPSSLKTMQMEDHSQGLISGENGKRVTASVLRRTLSATEMWRSQGGATIKKTASVKKLNSLIHNEEEGSRSEAFEEIWSSIQRKTKTEESEQRKTSADVWGSILSEKKDDVAPASYVHPLVKRSASSLSEKSLEICTESLGSETGSDVFSFLDSDKEHIGNDVVVVEEMKQQPRQQPEVKEVGPTVEVKATGTKRAAAAVAGEGNVCRFILSQNEKLFPPPLPSLGQRGEGSNVHMRCHRKDGRLVVEAVSVPSRNCFTAERQGGRLLLTFSGKESSSEEDEEFHEGEDMVEDYQDEEESTEDDNGEEEEEMEEEVNERAEMEKCGIRTMTKYVDYKFLCLTRRSAWTPPAPWAQRLNKAVPTLECDDVAKSTLKGGAQQLIPSAALVNTYVYSWRSKEVPAGGATLAEVKEVGGCNWKMQHAQPRRSDTTRCIATS